MCALAVHGGAALSAAGGRLGCSALRGAAGAAPLRPARLMHAGRGGKEKAPVAALALLPASRLLLVGAEDGTLRLCV